MKFFIIVITTLTVWHTQTFAGQKIPENFSLYCNVEFLYHSLDVQVRDTRLHFVLPQVPIHFYKNIAKDLEVFKGAKLKVSFSYPKESCWQSTSDSRIIACKDSLTIRLDGQSWDDSHDITKITKKFDFKKVIMRMHKIESVNHKGNQTGGYALNMVQGTGWGRPTLLNVPFFWGFGDEINNCWAWGSESGE